MGIRKTQKSSIRLESTHGPAPTFFCSIFSWSHMHMSWVEAYPRLSREDIQAAIRFAAGRDAIAGQEGLSTEGALKFPILNVDRYHFLR